MKQIRVLVVDDHPAYRLGIRTLVADNPEIVIVGESEDSQHGAFLASENEADVLILGAETADRRLTDVVTSFSDQYPDLKLLLCLSTFEPGLFSDLGRMGVRGCITKNISDLLLTEAIRAVSRGEFYLHIRTRWKQEMKNGGEWGSAALDHRFESLTSRERQVFRLVVQGFSSHEIAGELEISPRTVDNHRSNIMRKFSAHSQIELVMYAVKNGLVSH